MARRFNTTNEIETYISGERDRVIDELKGAYPVKIHLFLPLEDDSYDLAYGDEAGPDLTSNEFIEICVLISIDSYHASGFESGGSLVQGTLYSDDPAIISGAHLKIVRTVPSEENPSISVEELSARYEIRENLINGVTRTVENKWSIQSLPD